MVMLLGLTCSAQVVFLGLPTVVMGLRRRRGIFAHICKLRVSAQGVELEEVVPQTMVKPSHPNLEAQLVPPARFASVRAFTLGL